MMGHFFLTPNQARLMCSQKSENKKLFFPTPTRILKSNMAVPLKKRRIVLPQHMEVTPEQATSSVVVPEKAAEPSETSKNESSSLSSKYFEQAALVDTKLDHVKAMIKAQEILIARTTMQVFETCGSQAQAEQAIRSIRDLFMRESHDDRRLDTLSQTYVQLQAVPQILKAMTQYKESLKFISLATDVLKVLLFHSTKARKSFLQLGGTHILMKACQDHWFLPMTKAALGALANVAPILTRTDALIIEDCLAFTVKAMRVYDHDSEIQRLGTYFCLPLAAAVAIRQNPRAFCVPDAVSSSKSNSCSMKRKLEPCNQ